MCARRCAWVWVAVVAYAWRCRALEEPPQDDFNATQWIPWPLFPFPGMRPPSAPAPVPPPQQTRPPSAPSPSPPTDTGNAPIKEWYNNQNYTIDGKATYYGRYQSGGACGIDQGNGVAVPPEIANITFTVAMNTRQYNMGSCGMCIKLRGEGVGAGRDPVIGEFKVYVNNLCPECQWGHLDFGINGDGLWDIKWKAIPCEVGENKIKYAFVSSNTWYLRISPQATRYPVTSMQVYYRSEWVVGTKTNNQMYEFNSNNVQFTFPLRIRTTSVFNQTVEDEVLTLPNRGFALGSVQFPIVPYAAERLHQRLFKITGRGPTERHS